MRMDIFFYGLFMEASVLLANEIPPSNPRKGYLQDYSLKIGNRASLIPSKGDKAYGIVMTVDEADARRLYAEASVADYIPEPVSIMTETGAAIAAICYNLPPAALAGTNPSYAKALYDLARREGFPDAYLRKIRAMTTLKGGK